MPLDVCKRDGVELRDEAVEVRRAVGRAARATWARVAGRARPDGRAARVLCAVRMVQQDMLGRERVRVAVDTSHCKCRVGDGTDRLVARPGDRTFDTFAVHAPSALSERRSLSV